MRQTNDRLLRASLRANAAFSGVCGVVALATAGPLANALGVPEARILTVLGAQLLLFGGLLLFLAAQSPIWLRPAVAVVVADVLWVIGTVPVLLWVPLTPPGVWTAVAIAGIVAVFAVVQFIGIHRVRGPRTA